MGSGNSRLGSYPRRPHGTKRTFSSLFICGASSSRATIEMEDGPDELLVSSAEHAGKGKLKNSGKDSTPNFIPSQTEPGASSVRNLVNGEKSISEDALTNFPGGNQRESSPEDMELLTPYSPGSTGSETASTSQDDQPFPYPLSLNRRAGEDVVNNVGATTNRGRSQVFAGSSHSSSPLSHGNGESSSSEDFVGNHTNEILIFNNSDSGSVSVVSDSPLISHLVGDDLLQEAPASGLEFRVSEREEGVRDGSVLHVDSSNVLSNTSAEVSSREARRNSRRLFWDAFSRRSPRRRADSRNFHFPSDDSDNVVSHDRLLLDFSDNPLHGGAGGNFQSNGSRTHGSNARRWHSRSEMWERLPGGVSASDHRNTTCPTGVHIDGPCSCETVLMTRESGSRASISRIVMLAEALFEVLDEIHRQPMSFNLSALSVPAPESVVDSFPVRSYSKPEEVDIDNNVLQCHICLDEYEEGDKIRALPCHHEFHMSCVDKWLKEIHGVCPLCRGDVRNGITEGSISNSAAPSL